jgi:hypothetical protein
MIAENTINARPSNEVWFSSDAMTWSRRANPPPSTSSFQPPRYDSSCDVDTSHVLFIAGGRSGSGTASLLNDVVRERHAGRHTSHPYDASNCLTSPLSPLPSLLFSPSQWYGTNQGRNWNRATLRAPWRARASHLVIIFNSFPLGKTLLYVMGGISRDGSQDVTLENDVSDHE